MLLFFCRLTFYIIILNYLKVTYVVLGYCTCTLNYLMTCFDVLLVFGNVEGSVTQAC